MPTVFNKIYVSERALGVGGFGTVFLARENVSNRLVAIKQLNNQDATRQQAIVHEVQMVSQFNHPNIATYHHSFSENGLLFLVMEFCAGGSIRSAAFHRKVSSTEALAWVQTLAEVLAFVHGKKIIHHDIKPDNILLTETGTIKLSDFGIANLQGGTRAYMSPESLGCNASNIQDVRVDIYALGVTLMELLTGRNPFFNQTPEGIQALHDAGDFPIKTLPDWQQEIILKAINKVPELRFQSMGTSRRGHVLTLDRRRTPRGVCKSWPQGGSSRGGQAELVKKSPVLMGRPFFPQERSRHGEATKPPRLIPLGAVTNPNGSATDHVRFIFCC